ncbi:hypothetical protein BYT27DRAFT_7197867 [Phlegmacium glaucopus]|nr:hypothetical protein BYT27DRAFT_7197867 [Phlegmacium glaucopus]
MFPRISNLAIYGGVFNSQTNHSTSRGMDILLEWIECGAFHDSDELYDAPKCHPHTRVAVIADIMQWVDEFQLVEDDFMLWLFGPAGAGKSAIAKRIAEEAAKKGLLIATFFFSRTSPTRNNKDRLVATLAYQLALSIPDTRIHIENAIERDPAIFKKNIQIQLDTLLIKPLQFTLSNQAVPFPKLFVVDGLDECNDSQAQVTILHAISSLHKYKLPIMFLVVSRPEQDLITSFNNSNPLKFIHRRLALDDTYHPDNDIRLFFSDKFEDIKRTHPLRSTIPISWPTPQALEVLVRKSSGQFIYGATVVRFVESNRHRPTKRLEIILGIEPPGITNPFAELDALYHHILSSVDNIQVVLRVLSLYLATPYIQLMFWGNNPCESVDQFLCLEQGDVHLVLIALSSVVSYDELSGVVKILHTSLVDFLSDRRRSTIFYIDMASACTDFVHHIFQYVKAPDGIRAGDVDLFWGLSELFRWVLKDQLRSDILDFDFDAFMKAVTERYFHRGPFYNRSGIGNRVIWTFQTWTAILATADLEDEDRKKAVDQCNKSFETQLQIYQSDPRLQLLLTLAAANIKTATYLRSELEYLVPSCRCKDILLDLDNHALHLIDQRALDLRHGYLAPFSSAGLIDIITPFVDGDKYAFAALHCMHFLSNPPAYSEGIDDPNMGPVYPEWKATCDMTLSMLRKLLQESNASPELVQFISNHDIHPMIRKSFPVILVWWVDVHILAFLSVSHFLELGLSLSSSFDIFVLKWNS